MINEKIESMKRVGRAIRILFPILITHMRDTNRYLFFGSSRNLSVDEKRERARRLTDAFEELGVTYIKMAQFLTTRPDFVPPLYINEFQRLQDDIPPEDFEDIKKVLEEDLGPIDEVFDSFEEEAISGASIAQVHRAVLDGEDVAVKIRRPGIERIIEADLRIISFMARLITGFLKMNGEVSMAHTIEGLANEMEKNLNEEINLKREKEIMKRVNEYIERDGLDDEIVIPSPYDDYCTERVITMSFEDGAKIKELDKIKEMGLDIEQVVDRIVEAYLRMAFVYQVYQADPHDGNIAVNEDGQVIIYDYGLSVDPEQHVSDAFIKLFTGIGLEDPYVVLDAFEDMGAVDPTANRETMREFCDVIIKDVVGEVTQEEIEHLSRKVEETLDEPPMQLRQEIVLGMRTTQGVQGLSVRVAPNYNFQQKLANFFIEEDLIDQNPAELKEEARRPEVDVSMIKREIGEEIKRYNKKTALSIFGSAFSILGVILYIEGISLWLPTAGLGGLLLLAFINSYRAGGEVPPPARHMAMRYRMNQWDMEHIGSKTAMEGNGDPDQETTVADQ